MRRKIIISIFSYLLILTFVGFLGWNSVRIPSMDIPHNLNLSSEKGMMHISVDDTLEIFQDLSANKNTYTSIFDNPTLKFVKDLHDKYGAVISFYVFYDDGETDGFNLSKTTNRFTADFTDNSNWLKFGFHAKNYKEYEVINAYTEKLYYDKTINEIIRITGSTNCIDRFVRLDRYTADDNTIKALSGTNYGIKGLFIADDDSRKSYSLSKDETNECYLNDWFKDKYSVIYTPTDVRVENIQDDEDFYSLLEKIDSDSRKIIFTHEWVLNEKSVQKYLTWFCEYSNQYGIQFKYM